MNEEFEDFLKPSKNKVMIMKKDTMKPKLMMKSNLEAVGTPVDLEDQWAL